MRVTHYYLDLIDWDDPQDPIRKIAIPSLGEQKRSGTFVHQRRTNTYETSGAPA